MLFLIYINDIPNTTSLNLSYVADDTTIYQSDYDIDNLTTAVNQELNKIYSTVCKQAMFAHSTVPLVLKIATIKYKLVLK